MILGREAILVRGCSHGNVPKGVNRVGSGSSAPGASNRGPAIPCKISRNTDDS